MRKILIILLFQIKLFALADIVDVSKEMDDILSFKTEDTQCHDCRTDEVYVAKNNECQISSYPEEWIKNCDKLFSKNLPKNALRYALTVLKKNSTSFKTNKCYKLADPAHKSMMGLNKSKTESMMKDGYKNRCQIIINDTDERYLTHSGPGYKCKMASYYIDICKPEPTVIKSYAYIGYGTCKKGRKFENKSGKGTTLIGAFVTHTKTFPFTKFRTNRATGKRAEDAHYKKIRLWLKNKKQEKYIPSVALIGLQSSNNRSAADYKYLHVGAYTSAGCPSIDKKNYWMINELTKNGPSLVLNYAEGEMEDINACSK